MKNHLFSIWNLLALLFPAVASAQPGERDTTGVNLGLSAGAGYEQLDLDAFNARLADAGLHAAPDIPVMLRLDFLLATRHLFFTLGESFGTKRASTDSSQVRSASINLQIGMGYPVVRTRRMLLAPMVGYRLSGYTYTHYMELRDRAFDAALQSSTHEVQVDLTRHDLLLGAYWTYGRKPGVAVQAGYTIPFGSGAWHSTGTYTKLKDGPTIDPGLFVGISLLLRGNTRDLPN